MKRTKIICTIGPSSEKPAVLEKLIKNGMNVARLNFSHGTYTYHSQLIKTIRAAAKKQKRIVTLLQDLQGPRIRIGEVDEKGVTIKNGEEVLLLPKKEYASAMSEKSKKGVVMLPLDYANLANDILVGQHILIADGVFDLLITAKKGLHITCKVVSGGVIKSHKGINVPGATISIPGLTDKDKEDVVFGVKQGVDYMAMSFVKDAKDIATLRGVIKSANKQLKLNNDIGIIAKIERPEAIENFEEILEAVDGIMVARGDLGLEMPAQEIPLIQKRLISRCMEAGKPVIVATQMLESMIVNRRPTRAEVSDVANAVIDHTDAVMLSGESAAGKYPVEAVTMMADVIMATELSTYDDFACAHFDNESPIAEVMSHVASMIALRKKVAMIFVEDTSPDFVRMVASHRPEVSIVTCSDDRRLAARLQLSRGVEVIPCMSNVVPYLKKNEFVKKGDRVLILSGCQMEIIEIG